MKLTLRQQMTQFAHVLQTKLFPVLEEEVGELTEPAKRLIATLEMIPLANFLPVNGGWVGRPLKARLAIARPSSPRPSMVLARPDSCSWPCNATRNCGASVVGNEPIRCRMNPPFPAPSPSSLAWNCHSSCTRP